jgi:hypothetical protein
MADTDRRRADEDLAAGATVTIAQFRAVLQGFPETRPWGSSTPDVEVHAMTSPIKLSQHAQQDLRGLFGRRAMPKILAALDQLATIPSTGVTAWRHLGVEDYQVLYRRLPAGPSRQTPIYLVAGVTRRRDDRRPACPPPTTRPAVTRTGQLALSAVSGP